MARGRRFAPSQSTTQEGIWFCHRGSESAPPRRLDNTSTGRMLAEPFHETSSQRPHPPPQPFRSKTAINYKTTNRFSEHDNRNAFQDHGVYFGDGREDRLLGRKNQLPELRIHYTDQTYLKHNSRNPVDRDLHTTYGESYIGKPTETPPVHRRFPKVYKEPESGQVKLTTATPHWFNHPDVPHKTPTHVLAVSQEPFLKHNTWKYSNHGLRKIYPPYDRKNEPLINNELNKYGAAFVVGSN